MLTHEIEEEKVEDSETECGGIIKEENSKNINPILQSEVNSKCHEPIVIGNEKVQIINHQFFESGIPDRTPVPAVVQLAIRNISNTTIATVVFKTIFYDGEGSVVEEIKHREIELKPGNSRAITISSSIIGNGIVNHDTKIIKTIMADVERIQLRGYGMRTNENGEEEIQGTVRNISESQTSSTLIANFYNYDDEHIGSKVFIFKNIEPNTVAKFRILYKPEEGEKVRNCHIYIGDIVE